MSNEPFDYGKTKPDGQHERYPSSVKTNEDGTPAFVQPHRNAYRHRKCGVVTTMRGEALTLTYATNPGFYGATFCAGCHNHLPLAEFDWLPDGLPMDVVGGPVGVDWRDRETVPRPEWQVKLNRLRQHASDATNAVSRLEEYGNEHEKALADTAHAAVTALYEAMSTRIQQEGQQ
jgi:hypothetical protein